MRSPTYTLFRNAILGERQVVCSYDGRPRELCPHIIGINKSGEEVVLAWQFAGESRGRRWSAHAASAGLTRLIISAPFSRSTTPMSYWPCRSSQNCAPLPK
jgi:hypothetical protein